MDARLAWLKQAQPFVSSLAEKRKFISLVGLTLDPASLEILKPFLQDVEVAGEAQAASTSLIQIMKL